MVFLVKMRWIFFLVIIFAMIVAGHAQKNPFIVVTTKATPLPSISPAPSTSPSAAPTKVLNRGEMSNLYGPCIELPIILYHHIEPMSVAQQKKHTSLNIDSEVFRKQMEYLKQKGYSSVTPADLVAFFDEGMQLPSKPVMITFDDGYDDNGEYAYEILKQVGIKGVIFLPTGLMQNEGYLRWEKIMEMNSSGMITFGNHTWSHMNAGREKELVKKEISTADIQLGERGLNVTKVFAYPYGEQNGYTREYLEEIGYKLGFTTKNGRILCKGQRLTLPRVRVNGGDMTYYGF